MKPIRLLDGLALIAIYRVSLKVGMLVSDELVGILGTEAGFPIACLMTVSSIIILGIAARFYFVRTQ